MGEAFSAALIQFSATDMVGDTQRVLAGLIREAASKGAQYIQTPEASNLMTPDREVICDMWRKDQHRHFLKTLRELASDLGVYLHLGSLIWQDEEGQGVNRSFLIGADGRILAWYDKIHMFDVALPNGEIHTESRHYRAGSRAVVAELPWGRLGLSICYDLRFPLLYQALVRAGAQFLAIPAAFTRLTGEAHWHVLLRARAIETGCFVLAAAQCGTHAGGRQTFGHSLIIDPWGRVLAEGGTETQILTARIDPELVEESRRRIPVFEHRKDFSVAEPLPAARSD